MRVLSCQPQNPLWLASAGKGFIPEYTGTQGSQRVASANFENNACGAKLPLPSLLCPVTKLGWLPIALPWLIPNPDASIVTPISLHEANPSKTRLLWVELTYEIQVTLATREAGYITSSFYFGKMQLIVSDITKG